MFELIGLAIGTVILFLLATIIGSIFAFGAWIAFRRKVPSPRSWAIAAFAIPILSAACLWMCIAMLPGKSLFGDISQPLPNGYVLTGLGKMPDFSYVQKQAAGVDTSNEPGCVARLEVVRTLIIGQYGEWCRTTAPNAKPEDKYFVFETLTGKLINFPNLGEAEHNLGQPAHLVSSEAFESPDPLAIHQRMRNTIIEVGPPVMATLVFFVMAFREGIQLRG
jgi:hypothetical protein